MTLSADEKHLVTRLAADHSVSPEGMRTVLEALRREGGTMAQFSHADFGGMSQWSPGMTMIGDMFNNDLKTKLGSICTELAAHLANRPAPDNAETHHADVSYRSLSTGTTSSPAMATAGPASG